jgi:DNA polymerase III subunit delta
MTALKPAEIDRFLSKPNPALPIILLYGPDAGLIAERAEALMRSGMADPDDPFALVRLDGDHLASDPARLADEAHTIGLFGGKRVIRVRMSAREIAAAIDLVLKTPPTDCLIVVEAGDLAKRSATRLLCEKSSHAAVIACYADEPGLVARLLDQSLREAGLSIEREAREELLARLGGDRLATRGEIDKLILYMQPDKAVTLDHVEAAVGDASQTAVTALVDAAFLGDTPTIFTTLAKTTSEGLDANAIMPLVMGHAFLIAKALAEMEKGMPTRVLAERMIVYFKRRPVFERQLGLWRPGAVQRAITLLAEAARSIRQAPALADTTLERALMSLALSTRRRSA